MNDMIKKLLKISAVLGICGILLYAGVCLKEGGLVSVITNKGHLTILGNDQSSNTNLIEKTYHFDQVSQLALDIDIGDVEIKPADNDDVKVITEIASGFESRITCENGLLNISVKDTRKIQRDVKKQKITIYLPARITLEKANINLALGTLEIKEMEINQLTIIASLGDVELKNMVLIDPDITLRLGDFDFEGSFSGKFYLENNLGDADLTIRNNQAVGYNLHTDMGEIELNDRTVVSMNGNYIADENAADKVIATLNLGDLDIKEK